MSVRRGIRRPFPGRGERVSARADMRADETVEQVGGVVRAGRGLRVVLHGEGAQGAVLVLEGEPLDDVVVEPDVADAAPSRTA